MSGKSPTPGLRWRVLAHRRDGSNCDVRNDGVFDELVVDDWLHVEQMSRREWWAQIGDARVWIRIPKHGPPEVSIWRGEYGPQTPAAAEASRRKSE